MLTRDRSLIVFGGCALLLSVILAMAVTGGDKKPSTSVGKGEVAPAPATAAMSKVSPPAKRKLEAPRGVQVGDAWKSMGSLILVLLAVAGSALVAKRFLKKTRFAPSGEKVLSVLDAVPLGPKRQVYVLQVYERKLVVAATEQNVSLLTEFTEEEISKLVAEVKNPVAAGSPQTPLRGAELAALMEVEA